MKNTTISNYDQHVQANELKKSQDQRTELQKEFEEMRDLYEKSDKYKIFYKEDFDLNS
jgi:hypothetical protein